VSATKAVTDASFEADVLMNSKPVLVDYWAEWCGPCRQVAPVLEEIAREFGSKIDIVKLNVDQNPYVVQNYGIMNIPTLSVFKNGQVVKPDRRRQAQGSAAARACGLHLVAVPSSRALGPRWCCPGRAVRVVLSGNHGRLPTEVHDILPPNRPMVCSAGLVQAWLVVSGAAASAAERSPSRALGPLRRCRREPLPGREPLPAPREYGVHRRRAAAVSSVNWLSRLSGVHMAVVLRRANSASR